MTQITNEKRQRVMVYWPLPSVTCMYLRSGGLVSLSTRPLGHLISMLSIFVAAPMPRISRGSCEERKLPPAVLRRLYFTPPASHVIIAPTASGLLLVATSCRPTQLLRFPPSFFSSIGAS